MSKNKKSNTVFILQAQKATTLGFQKKIRQRKVKAKKT